MARQLVCKKCGSANVSVQMVGDTHTETRHHGLLWKLAVGWWWIPIKWVFLTLPAAIVRFLGNNRHETVTTMRKHCICQSCGYSWEVK